MIENTGEGPSSFLRYNPTRTDYSVSENELTSLENSSQNNWKDYFLVAISVSIPTLINAISDTEKPFILTIDLFLNYLVGIVGLSLSAVFYLSWRRTKSSFDNMIDRIKSKPPFQVQVSNTSSDSPTMFLGNIQQDTSIFD